MAAADLRAEVVGLARALVRVDTSNPPGGETAAAEVLAEYLRGAGVEPELVGPDPKRLNLVARIEGGDGPSIMLLGHTDVVPAPDAAWTVPPFDAVEREGTVLGRGIADMKGELAARAVAFAELARSGVPPAGDVVLVAEADEERNTADVGLSWLVRDRPDLRCDLAINEGGGLLLELADGRRVVTISVGEKRVSSLRLRVFGRAGHASVPASADNPLRHVATAIERLLAYEPEPELDPTVSRALEVLGVGDGPEAIAGAAALHPVLAETLPVMVRMTVTPTGLESFEPSNVIPPFADVICDCRALPGQGEAEVHDHVARALGDGFEYEVELIEPLEGGTESAIDTPLYRLCEAYVAERLDGARLLPLITPGFTDSHWIREAFGTIAYGFAPVFATEPRVYLDGMHGADEALAVDDLVEMTRFNMRAIGAPDPG
jgi:acetylornithine deacetylase/succinyl-diaminopimelate desuccinylase-like protein